MATIPASPGLEQVPVVAFFAHVDTSPDFSGTAVKPIVHRRWRGRPIRFPDAPQLVLDARQSPELQAHVGDDLVTASGQSLLGADDKAGIAILMTLVSHLLGRSSFKHGPLRVCFLPDEEVGRHGARTLDLNLLGARN